MNPEPAHTTGPTHNPDDPPLWQVIASALRADILDGHHTPGSPLPSENDLAKRYSVSRPTVRDALKTLVLEGLVSVVRGRGTFVRPIPDRFTILLGARPAPDLASPTFTDTAKTWGWQRAPIPDEATDDDPEVYGRQTFIPANRDIAGLLYTRIGHRVFHRYSLWKHTKQRYIEVNSYTNADLIPDWPNRATEYQTTPHAFYKAIQADSGRTPIIWRTTVTARMPYETERLRLHLEVGAPILLIRRTMTNRDGQPIEVTEVKAPAEEFETAHIHDDDPEHSAEYAEYLLDQNIDIDEHRQQTGRWPTIDPDGPVILAL
ncbi:GntR family transcriptional regulator [Thermopolyspora sp. NPDC052614]|uniref:GntR family transcriptional regulator n=1 Tax=Thermopolyspora sp. NPDC052614 TaxID=3155682 RepID=UPI003443094E